MIDYSKPLRVIICGDRYWEDEATIGIFLEKLNKESVVIHGACKGADITAGRLAKEMGLKVKAFPADWSTYGNAAGPIRNRQMVADGNPDLVVAFHNNLSQSKGTKDMLNVAKESGIMFLHLTSED